MPVFCPRSSNVSAANLNSDQLEVTDRAIIGTAFKEGGSTRQPVSVKRFKDLMDKIKDLR